MAELSEPQPTREQWRPVEGYPGYTISSQGRLRSKAGKISVSKPARTGYVQCSVSVRGVKKMFMRHVLVAKAFIENPDSTFYTTVNHINGIKHDNTVENLEWCSMKENCQRRVNPRKNANYKGRLVSQYAQDGITLIREYCSVAEAARVSGIEKTAIARSISGDHRIASGPFTWTFSDTTQFENENFKQITLPETSLACEVSSLGRVRMPNGKTTYGSIEGSGYYKVHINYNSYYVHRLVAIGFLSPVINMKDLVVDHIDNNRQNNRPENLRWCTARENVIHAIKFRTKKGNGRERPVIQMSLTGEVIGKYSSMIEATAQTGVGKDGIYHACKHRKTAGGYAWLYVDEEGGAAS